MTIPANQIEKNVKWNLKTPSRKIDCNQTDKAKTKWKQFNWFYNNTKTLNGKLRLYVNFIWRMLFSQFIIYGMMH